MCVIPGEVYNVGRRVGWEMDIKEYSDLVRKVTGADESLVTYKKRKTLPLRLKQSIFLKQ